jgi:hypothetical protein
MLSPDSTRSPAKRAKRLQKPSKAKGADKMRLVTLDHLDNRTMASRRVHQMIERISRDLTGDDDQMQLSEGTRQLIQNAAMLAAMIESSASAWLSGDPVDLNSYFAALNNQRRILVTLGLERRAKDITFETVQQINDRIHAARQVPHAEPASEEVE